MENNAFPVDFVSFSDMRNEKKSDWTNLSEIFELKREGRAFDPSYEGSSVDSHIG